MIKYSFGFMPLKIECILVKCRCGFSFPHVVTAVIY